MKKKEQKKNKQTVNYRQLENGHRLCVRVRELLCFFFLDGWDMCVSLWNANIYLFIEFFTFQPGNFLKFYNFDRLILGGKRKWGGEHKVFFCEFSDINLCSIVSTKYFFFAFVILFFGNWKLE